MSGFATTRSLPLHSHIKPNELRRILLALAICFAAIVASMVATPLHAQNKTGFGFGGNFGGGFSPAQQNPYTITSEYEIEEGGNRGRLTVEVSLTPGYHIFSTTTPDGGPLKTKISIKDEGVELLGPFTPDHDPEIVQDENFPGIDIEEYHEEVTWSAPISVPESFQQSTLSVYLEGQVCESACLPVEETIDCDFAGFYAAATDSGEFRAKDSHVLWTGKLDKTEVDPGDNFQLTLTATPDSDFHVYELGLTSEDPLNKTIISIDRKAGFKLSPPVASTETVTKEIVPEEPPVVYHEGPVSWTIKGTVPPNAKAGLYSISGLLGFQACSDHSCDIPAGLRFSGEIIVGDPKEVGVTVSENLAFLPAKYSDVLESDARLSWMDGPKTYTALPLHELAYYLGLAFIGGFVLNFMPCVLPVIGLKIMSFMNEGGSRSRFVYLNACYMLGIFAVVMGFAFIALIYRNYGATLIWGEQYGDINVRIFMVVLLTAMSLSFLGVWEIPIPGFATSSKSGDAMAREGAIGAFLKGVLTTFLAIPCSGPGLGATLALTGTQPAWVVLLIFLALSFGLSVPYIAVSLYPKAIDFLPKPGPWMETLKQVLAFPLLLTVVYFVSQFSAEYRIAAMMLVVFVWFACWLIGQVPVYESVNKRATAWVSGIAVALLGGFISFQYFGPITHYLEWEPYSEERLAEARAEGKTVLIDFTAEWCQNCRINERVAIDTARVKEVVEDGNAITLIADFTDKPAHIKAKLEELNSISIPLLAVYPGDEQSSPIVLRDLLSESQVVEALEQAIEQTSPPAEEPKIADNDSEGEEHTDNAIETVSMEPPKRPAVN